MARVEAASEDRLLNPSASRATGSALALLVALGPAAGSAAATYLTAIALTLRCRLAIGTAAGLALLGLVALGVGSVAGLTPVTALLAASIASLPLLLLLLPAYRDRAWADVASARRRLAGALSGSDRDARVVLVGSVAWTIFFWALFSQAMFQDGTGIHTTSYASRADLPFHIAIVSGFADGSLFPPEHPEFAGAALTYPFLADLVAAVFRAAGASLQSALFLGNILLAIALVTLVECWTYALTRSRTAAIFAPPLIFLGATLGWIVMLSDLRESANPLWFFAHLPRSYTLHTANLFWGNLTTILLLPQRSLLLGLPLVLTVSLLWWRAVADDAAASPSDARPDRADRAMALAGVAAGLLPLAHTHSFAVVMMTGAGLALLFRRWRAWTVFFAVAGAIALPQLWAVAHGSQARAASFVGWAPGWSQGPESFWWFWFKNTGLFIPLLVAGLLWPARSAADLALRRFYLPFVLCFIVPDLLRLAPRVWDNNKVLIYWYVASTPIVALVLARLWRRRLAGRLVAAGLLVSLSLSGLLDAWRVISGATTVTVFDRPAVAFADVLRQKTDAHAVVVRAPTAAHTVMLAGRRSVLGWTERVRSHGIETSAREADVRAVYEGTAAPALLVERYRADYLVVGPPEREWVKVDDRLARLPLAGEAGGYRLYVLRPASARP